MAICGKTKSTVGSGQGKGTAIVAKLSQLCVIILAQQLSQNYHTKLCPICLEVYDGAPWDETGEASYGCKNKNSWQSSSAMKQVDSHGIPTWGNDGRPLKDVFDGSCWTTWENSGFGNPCNCPVCRQDVGKSAPSRKSRFSTANNDSTATAAAAPKTIL